MRQGRNETQATKTRPLGRPRAHGVNDQILTATLELLDRDGYDGMSIASVATHAGITKPTLYRRFESKEELVTSAVSTLAATGPSTVPEDPWEALVAELVAFHDAIGRPGGMALVGVVLALEHKHPQLVELYRRKVVDVRRARIRASLKSGQAKGVIREDINLDTVVTMLVGYYYSARVAGADLDEQWPRQCIDFIRPALEST